MADERDPRVSRRYRELGSEEPPPKLDHSVVSAACRALEHPHAPLVTPSGRHRWYFSLGAAAVIVLAVAVTYQMQQEQPDPYANGARRQEAKPAAAPEAIPPQPAEGAPAARSLAKPMQAPAAAETPERMLERIVELRKQGKNEEADRVLAEFKRRYPGYRIPENVVRP